MNIAECLVLGEVPEALEGTVLPSGAPRDVWQMSGAFQREIILEPDSSGLTLCSRSYQLCDLGKVSSRLFSHGAL